MSNAELSLQFSSRTAVNVIFDGVESGQLAFADPLTPEDRHGIRWYVETYGATSLADPDDREARRMEARLPEIGKALFQAVFTPPEAYQIFLAFRNAPAQPRVLTINAQDAAILALPWELLHDPTGNFLFRERPHISVRRKISGASGGRTPFRVEPKDHLHLLFVVSRPKDAGFIDPRADPQAVLNALDELAPGRVTCEFLRPATLNALAERLDDDRKPAIDILHFDGHGVFKHVSEAEAKSHPERYGKTILGEIQRERQARSDAASGKAAGIGFLIFENAEDRTAHYVSAADLSDNLFQAKVGLVVLSACQTATLDGESSDPMASVAGRLTTTGIPAILAMTHSVLVATTRMLFGKFYESLARGRGIATSLDDARIYLANNPGKYEVQRGETRKMLELKDWFLPALFHGGSDAPLLTAQAVEAATVAANSNLRRAHEAGFFGRRRELWDIERWFATGLTRRISITGFGGQGKTELALEAGRWLMRAGMFKQAVWVDYAGVQAKDALAVAVSTIGTVLEASLIDAAAVTQALTATPTLVILDNLETVSADALRELLDAAVAWSNAGASRVLLTSRTPDFNHPDYRIEGTRIHRCIALKGLGSASAPHDALDWFGELSKLPPEPSVPVPKREALIKLFDRVQFHPLSIAVLAQQLKTRSAERLGERLEAILHEDIAPGVVAEETPSSLIASLQLSLEGSLR
ncbi:CHAT domain-containing protein [Candidatus Entotheonella palauensis]|uniref:CHAT domain-containing protein n=1 Tax=Candidatus Entotheonella palauensis TaxID=93172 RepID=UPI000B7DD5D3